MKLDLKVLNYRYEMEWYPLLQGASFYCILQ